jgi:hypothetical protein
VNYLEVILDKKLDSKAHLEHRIRKESGKDLGVIRLSPKVVAWLYTSVVRPILSYMLRWYGGGEWS